MAQLDKAEKDQIIHEAMVEVYRTTDGAVRKSRVSQCRFNSHVWHKLSDSEVACNICPTVLILGEDKVREMFPPEATETLIFEADAVIPTPVEPPVVAEEPII